MFFLCARSFCLGGAQISVYLLLVICLFGNHAIVFKNGKRNREQPQTRPAPHNGAQTANTSRQRSQGGKHQDQARIARLDGVKHGGRRVEGARGRGARKEGGNSDPGSQPAFNLLQMPPNLFNPEAFAKAMGLTNKFDTRFKPPSNPFKPKWFPNRQRI